MYEADDMPAPWIVFDRSWMLCLQCPTGKMNRKGHCYYLGVNTRRKTTRQVRVFVRHHEWCGFEGLME